MEKQSGGWPKRRHRLGRTARTPVAMDALAMDSGGDGLTIDARQRIGAHVQHQYLL